MKSNALACWIAASWVCTALAQEPEHQAIELFEAARNVDMITPTFPPRAAMRGEEGWVILDFMIDEEGRAFEPMVVDAIGDDQFVDAALTALDDSTFAPASISGNPITSSKTVRYVFVLEGHENGARPAFVSRFRRFTQFINDDDQEMARAELQKLEEDGAHSLYEDAFLNLARYYYAVKYGSSVDQMTYLERALFFDDADSYETYLPAAEALKLWPQLFVLQAQNRRFAEALDTYEIISRVGADDAKTALADAVAQFSELATDDTSYTVTASTDSNGSWNIGLFKDEFYLTNLEANINEIKLRCDQRYVFFEFEAETQYKVPPQFGQCELEVLGDADAGFELVQL